MLQFTPSTLIGIRGRGNDSCWDSTVISVSETVENLRSLIISCGIWSRYFAIGSVNLIEVNANRRSREWLTTILRALNFKMFFVRNKRQLKRHLMTSYGLERRSSKDLSDSWDRCLLQRNIFCNFLVFLLFLVRCSIFIFFFFACIFACIFALCFILWQLNAGILLPDFKVLGD